MEDYTDNMGSYDDDETSDAEKKTSAILQFKKYMNKHREEKLAHVPSYPSSRVKGATKENYMITLDVPEDTDMDYEVAQLMLDKFDAGKL